MLDTLPLIAHAIGLASALTLWGFALRALWWRWRRPRDSAVAQAEVTQWHAQRGGFMIGYRFKDTVRRAQASGFFQVVDMTTRKDLAALKPGSQVRVTYCTYAPVLSCLEGSESAFRTYAAIMLTTFSLIVLWQAAQLLPDALAFAG